MAKILVKSPITSNGRDVVIGPDGKIRYKETIVEAAAGPIFEKMNAKKPAALKYIITPFEGEGYAEAPSISGKQIKKKKDELL